MKNTLIIPMIQLLILVSAIYTGITRIQVIFLFTNRPVLVSLTLRASHFYVFSILCSDSECLCSKIQTALCNNSNLLKHNFIDYNN